MRFGARVLKTGVAVMVALFVCHILELQSPAIAAIAAAAAIQPSVYRSIKQFRDQLQAQIIGAFFAISAISLFGYNPILIGIVVMLTIAINLYLKFDGTIQLSIVTVIAVMENTSDNYLEFSIGRLSLVLIGICAATIVNLLFLPPNHEHKLNKKMLSLSGKSMTLMRNMLHSHYHFKAFRTEKNEILKEFDELEQIHTFYREQKPMFSRRPIKKMREMVIYEKLKHMIEDQTDIVQVYRQSFFVFNGQDHLRQSFQEALSTLIFYQESILLKFDNKIAADFELEHAQNAKNSILKLQTLISEQSDAPLLPLLGQMSKYADDLIRLDRYISRYTIYRKKEAE